jgi:hypothetical protein
MFLREKITRLSADKLNFYVDLSPQADFCLKFTSFENGLQVFRKNGNQWESENRDPGIRLLLAAHDNHPDLPVSEFIQEIPAELRSKIADFEYLQIKILQICAQSREGLELFSDLPVLVWLIADFLHKNKLTGGYGKSIVCKKRRIILKEILGKGSNADVQMLKKIQIQNQLLNRYSFSAIQYALENDENPTFRHLRTIPLQLLTIRHLAPHIMKSGFGQMLAEQKYLRHSDLMQEIDRVQRLIVDITRLGEMLQVDMVKSLKKCDSTQSLETLHDQWTQILNRKENSVYDEKIHFPEAPLKDNDEIIQIRTLADLKEEGRFMHHCVASYARTISKGESYIFKVLGPERATLEIKIDGKNIQIGGFKCEYNRTPSDETYQFVTKWIEACLNKRDSASNSPTAEIKLFPNLTYKKKRHLRIVDMVEYDIPVFAVYPDLRT